MRTKYVTDEEDYTRLESISFAVLTNQQLSQATTVLAGFAYDNIYYVFDIEVSAACLPEAAAVRTSALLIVGRQAENHLLARRPAGSRSDHDRRQSHVAQRWPMASTAHRTV